MDADKFKETGEREEGGRVKRGLVRKTNTKGGATIERVAEAARKILVTEGTERFTMDRIAKAAGVTKGTLLYHFHDKEALLELLMNDYVAHLEAELQKGIDKVRASGRKFGPGEDVIAGFIEWYRTFRKQNASYTSFGLSILSLSAQNDAMRKSIENWYVTLFARLRATGRRDTVGAALMLEGLFFLRHFRLDVTTDEEVEGLLERIEASLEK